MSDKLQELIIKAQKLSEEYDKVALYGCESLISDWPEQRQAHYISGPIVGMFLDKDPELMDYIYDLSQLLELDSLKRNILWLMEADDKEKKKSIRDIPKNDALKSKLERILYESSAEKYRAIIAQTQTVDELDTVLHEYTGEILSCLDGESSFVRMKYLLCYIEYRKIISLKIQDSFFSKEQAELDVLYKDYYDKNSEYYKYGLITCEPQKKLIIVNPPRIYDEIINKTIVLALPESIVSVINDLMYAGLIGKASFRATGTILDGRNDRQYICEAVERGQIFTLDYKSLSDVSKLYISNDNHTEYDDQLWVVKKENDLYFEELDSDFDIYDEAIVTRLLHIQVQEEKTSNGFKINHMDYEFIFYTIDEFEQRKIHAYTKGAAGKRKKMFKLDYCTIPIDYKVKVFGPDYSEIEVLFLQYVLNMFFKHKELLDEYFSDVTTSCK
ncbi:MAG: hypothetical protein IKW81_06750 [Pseudobutyrivibrio sp.]|nr:hypothetical protein [Pseudobutyrivibrio sp.]